jgi:hypothetical protein
MRSKMKPEKKEFCPVSCVEAFIKSSSNLTARYLILPRAAF